MKGGNEGLKGDRYEERTHSINLFTNVSQIYGCFFPRDLVTIHFINLYLTMVF